MSDVRRAQVNDIADLTEFLVGQFYTSHADDLPLLDVAKTARTVAHVVANGYVFMLVDQGEIIGSIGVAQTSQWFSSEPLLADIWYFVKPEARNSGKAAATPLLKAAIAQANQAQLPLRISTSLGGDVQRMTPFFTRKGFKQLGGIYQMEVTDV